MIILNINKEIWIDTGLSIENSICLPLSVAVDARTTRTNNISEICEITTEGILYKIFDQVDDPVKRLIRSQMMTIVDK